MTDRNIIEQAYCFFHQKWRVYSGKSSETQKDDIEYAISSYADSMSLELFDEISCGNPSFLREHVSFEEDMKAALERLESMMEGES